MNRVLGRNEAGQKNKKILNSILMLMVLIYAVHFIQFAFPASKELITLARMNYAQRVDTLDDEYYHNTFYRYYLWLNSALPPAYSFSILFDGSVADKYFRYERKLNYYLYPRYVLPGEKTLLGYADNNVSILKGTSDIKDIRYSELVLTLNNKANYKSAGKMKYTILNNKPYFLVSALDNKGLLAERSFINSNVRTGKEWAYLRAEFKKLYGINMSGAAF